MFVLWGLVRVGIVSAALVSSFAIASWAVPMPTSPAVTVSTANPDFVVISVSGSGFLPNGDKILRVYRLDGTYLEIFPTAPICDPNSASGPLPCLVVWADFQIVAKVAPPSTFFERILFFQMATRIGGVDQLSNIAAREHYDLSFFQTTGHGPGALAVDEGGKVWVNAELVTLHQYIDTIDGSAHQVYFPHAFREAGERAPFFVGCWFPDGCTGCCSYRDIVVGESSVIDWAGRAWLTQTGWPAPSMPGDVCVDDPSTADNECVCGTKPGDWFSSHSRLVMFDGSTDQNRVVYAPGDQNGVWGIAADLQRNRIWFGNQAWPRYTGSVRPARLIRFDPDTLGSGLWDPFQGYLSTQPRVDWPEWDTTYCVGMSPSQPGTCSNAPSRACFSHHDCFLMSEVARVGDSSCAGADPSTCFVEYDLPHTGYPINVAVHSDGSAWYANGDGPTGWAVRSVGRVDPDSGDVKLIPFASANITHGLRNGDTTTPNPLDIEFTPDGDAVVWLSTIGTLARIDVERLQNDPQSCTSLSPSLGVCQVTEDPGHVPPIYCSNPCVELFPDPACGDGTIWCDHRQGAQNMATSLHIASSPTNDQIWYGRGYLRRTDGQSAFVFFPPLAAIYPSPGGGCDLPFCIADSEHETKEQCRARLGCSGPDCPKLCSNSGAGFLCPHEFGGLGEDVALDRYSGDIFSKVGCQHRVYRLHKDPSILD